MAIRCKMRLDDVISNAYGGKKAFFRCEYDVRVAQEDINFALATPQGHAEFIIDNPKAAEQLVIGASYYVDFRPVPVAKPAPDPAAA